MINQHTQFGSCRLVGDSYWKYNRVTFEKEVNLFLLNTEILNLSMEARECVDERQRKEKTVEGLRKIQEPIRKKYLQEFEEVGL